MSQSVKSNKRFTLFLDFDGVLNNQKYLRFQKNNDFTNSEPFDSENIKNLNKLCKIIKFEKIVISSSWKKSYPVDELAAMLKLSGFLYSSIVKDTTENLSNSSATGRSSEIKQYITKHNIKNYIILDDLNLASDFKFGFYRVSSVKGFTSDIVDKIIKLISEQA